MKALALVLGLFSATAAVAATPPEGVELQVRRGFFTETDIGGFFTLGGDDAYSNLQTYLQLGIGYDFSDKLEVGGHVGIGSNAQNCFSGKDSLGLCTRSDNFTVTFLNLSLTYLVRMADRFYLTPRVLGGYTLLDPAPTVRDGDRPVGSGVNVGAGVGVEYATSMDHFSVGFDAVVRVITGPNIVSLQFFPRVKYTF